MKPALYYLSIVLILSFWAFTPNYPMAKVKNPISIESGGVTQRDSILLELNKIMNFYAGSINNEITWTAVKQKMNNFLMMKWRLGILKGFKSEDAFFIMVGHQIMTQVDIDNNKLIVLVGFSLNKPAEFETIKLEKQLRKFVPGNKHL